MVQTFAVFEDDPTILEIKTAKSLFLLEPLMAFSQKFAPTKITRYTVGVCTLFLML